MYFFFGYFWSLTFPGEDQEEWRTSNTYEHESYTNYSPLDRPWWRNNYRRRLELHTLEVLQTPSVGEVCEYPEVSSFLNSYLVLELVLVLASCSTKKVRGVAMVMSLLLTKHHGKYSQCPTFDIKQSPTGRSPEDHQVRAHAYLPSNNAQSCFVLPLSILVRSSLDVCLEIHS